MIVWDNNGPSFNKEDQRVESISDIGTTQEAEVGQTIGTDILLEVAPFFSSLHYHYITSCQVRHLQDIVV